MLMFVSFLFHVISIHAPREGSDQGVHDFFCRARQISIHAPREGSDGPGPQFRPLLSPISIHAPREGSDMSYPKVTTILFDISIHAPREGSDFGHDTKKCVTIGMISIHATREGSDWTELIYSITQHISIHAPREGSDTCEWSKIYIRPYFYPRSPRGERLPSPDRPRVCFKTIKLTKAKCKREKQPHGSRRLFSHNA